MKKMTKVLAVLCTLAMLLVVAGCSSDEDAGDNTSTNGSKAESLIRPITTSLRTAS